MIHLDTSFLIRALIQGSPQDLLLRRWIRAGEPLGMSAIAWVEFLCGPVDGDQVQLASQIITERTNFSEDHAVIASRLFNASGRHRGSLIDCIIAATAVATDTQLATANATDFRQFQSSGLEILEADKA